VREGMGRERKGGYGMGGEGRGHLNVPPKYLDQVYARLQNKQLMSTRPPPRGASSANRF